MLDFLILNGSCPDFEAGEMKLQNIGIKDGKIAFVGGVDEAVPEAADLQDLKKQ